MTAWKRKGKKELDYILESNDLSETIVKSVIAVLKFVGYAAGSVFVAQFFKDKIFGRNGAYADMNDSIKEMFNYILNMDDDED